MRASLLQGGEVSNQESGGNRHKDFKVQTDSFLELESSFSANSEYCMLVFITVIMFL